MIEKWVKKYPNYFDCLVTKSWEVRHVSFWSQSPNLVVDAPKHVTCELFWALRMDDSTELEVETASQFPIWLVNCLN